MAALTFGNIAAGTEGFYQGRALSRKDETEQLALAELRRQDEINRNLSRLEIPELPSVAKIANVPGMEEVQVPTTQAPAPAAPATTETAPTQFPASVSPETRQAVTQAPEKIPYGQMVPNPSADPLMLQRATEMAQLNKMKVDSINDTLKRTDLPPNIRRNLEQQRDMYQQRLDANNQVITRNQPTIDYGREGRNYVQQQAQPNVILKNAQAYDATKTVYDDVIANTAKQYGIDPVVFKRLIGTESSFRPDAVNRINGQPVAFGIAQIYKSNIGTGQGQISQADAMDPLKAIPYAAQLFAQYLKEAGGNYEQALYRYKGATSVQGRTAMATPIATILAGINQPGAVQTAAAPSATTPAPAGTQLAQAPVGTVTDTGVSPTATAVNNAVQQQAAGVKVGQPVNAAEQIVKPTRYYLANPQSITPDMQRALDTRQELVNMARIYQRAGAGKEFILLREQIRQLDNGMYQLQGMQGLAEFTPTYGYDSRRLSAVWSHYAQVPVAVQPRSDGKFNVFVNGQLSEQGLTSKEVSERARLTFDSGYRQSQATAQATMSMKSYETMLEIQKGNASEMAKMVREIAVGQQKGNYDMALETLKQNKFEVKPVGTDGIVIITPPFGGTPYLFNPAGQTLEIDGVKVTSKAAIPISGLPTVVQQSILSRAR